MHCKRRNDVETSNGANSRGTGRFDVISPLSPDELSASITSITQCCGAFLLGVHIPGEVLNSPTTAVKI